MKKLQSPRLPLVLATIIFLDPGSLILSKTAQAQGQDYSKGFDLLFQLGLPDLSDWEYVHTEAANYHHSELSELQESIKLTGNTWMEPTADGQEIRRYTLDGLTLSATIDAEIDSKDSQVEAYRKLLNSGISAANAGYQLSPRPAEEKADAEALVNAVLSALEDGEKREGLLGDPGALSKLFFLSAHWHRRGMPEPAARLVDALFARLPRKAVLIEVAMAEIANQRQAAAMSRFAGSGDWKQLETELESILKDFPRFWQERPLAERLLSLVKPRAAGEPAPMTSTADFPLNEEQLEWWNEVTTSRPLEDLGGYGSSPEQMASIWVRNQLPWPEEDSEEQRWQLQQMEGSLFDPSKDWNWLTLMAAGLGDQTLTGAAGDRLMYPNSSSSWRDLETEPTELEGEELEQHWRNMARPYTRDELARAFLRSAVPQAEDDAYDWWETAEADEVRPLVKEWRDKLEAAEGRAVIDLYLAEGGDQEKQMAATLLARTGDDADLAKLEEMTLTTPRQAMQIAMEIVKRKREAGADYLAKFTEKLRAELKEQNSRFRQDQSAEKQEEEFQRYYGTQLKSLEAIVSGKGLPEMLEAFVAGESDSQQFASEVRALEREDLSQKDAESALAAVLDIGPGRDLDRGYLMNMAIYIVRLVITPEEEEEEAPLTAEESPEPPADVVLPDWLVTSLSNLAEKGEDLDLGGNAATVRLAALWHADSLTNGYASSQASMKLQGLPTELAWTYFAERGKARLAGEPAPEVPSPESVSEERRKELTASLDQVGSSAWADQVATLTLPEAMALRDILEENPPPEEKRQQAALRVGKFTFANIAEERQAAWRELGGATLDPAHLRKILQLCQDQSEGSPLMGTVSGLPLLLGLQLTIASPEDENDPTQRYQWGPSLEDFRDEDTKPSFTRLAYLNLQMRSRSASVIRLLDKEGKWKPQESDDAPPGFYGFPFQSPIAEADLDGSLAEFLEVLGSADVSGGLRFGTMIVGDSEKKETP